MKFKTIYNADGIKTLKNNQFINFDILNKHVIPGVHLYKGEISTYISIYVKDNLYGVVFIDNGYLGGNEYYPIIIAGRYTHMHGLHLIDRIDLTDVHPELKNRDFILTENMLKNLVVAQLRKSYPMAVWPNPK